MMACKSSSGNSFPGMWSQRGLRVHILRGSILYLLCRHQSQLRSPSLHLLVLLLLCCIISSPWVEPNYVNIRTAFVWSYFNFGFVSCEESTADGHMPGTLMSVGHATTVISSMLLTTLRNSISTLHWPWGLQLY